MQVSNHLERLVKDDLRRRHRPLLQAHVDALGVGDACVALELDLHLLRSPAAVTDQGGADQDGETGSETSMKAEERSAKTG